MGSEKNITKVKKSVISIILLVIIISIPIMIYIKCMNGIVVTQFTNNSNSQMMGYAIKTKTGKIIMIDGGTISEAPDIEKYILDNGGRVDYWILTHQHKDHIRCIY